MCLRDKTYNQEKGERLRMFFGFQKERRGGRRKRMNLPIHFRLYSPSRPEVSSLSFPARLDNISEQGMCLLTDSIQDDNLHILLPSMTTSEQCQLEIKILAGQKPITLHGKAVWYDRNSNDQPYQFRAGIEFLHLTRDEKKQIHSLLNESSTENIPSAA